MKEWKETSLGRDVWYPASTVEDSLYCSASPEIKDKEGEKMKAGPVQNIIPGDKRSLQNNTCCQMGLCNCDWINLPVLYEQMRESLFSQNHLWEYMNSGFLLSTENEKEWINACNLLSGKKDIFREKIITAITFTFSSKSNILERHKREFRKGPEQNKKPGWNL